MDEPIELTVKEALVIRPGDHLLIRCDGDINPGEAAELRQIIKAQLPLLSDVTILANATGLAVFRAADHD
jgi:hypothetical protein